MVKKKTVLVCVKKDLVNPVGFALREFDRLIQTKYYDTTKHLEQVIGDVDPHSLIILDSHIGHESTIGFAKSVKEGTATFKILLIASSETPKKEIVELIQSKVVNGVLLRPFTAEQLSDNIYKLCGFHKPEEKPWYMHTGLDS